MQRQIGAYTLDICRDDRGRIVAEVWHNRSGKTLAITEVENEMAAKHWAKRLVDMQPPEEEN